MADRADGATPAVSVCIVNWNTRDDLRTCLNVLGADALPPVIEVIVLDNASEDGSAAMVAEEFPRVTLLAQRENLMFGRGANEAARRATGRYVLFLNADVQITPEQVLSMAEFMRANPRVGASSAREQDAQGKLRPLPRPPPTLGGELLNLLALRRLLLTRRDPDGPQPGLMGFCLMLPRSLGEELGYFDPAYHLYIEDTDLCLRVRKAGYELRYVPGVVVTHRHGRSSAQVDRAQRWTWQAQGAARLISLHYPPVYGKAVLAAALLGALWELLLCGFAVLLTLGQVRYLRTRLRALPKIAGIHLRALLHGARER